MADQIVVAFTSEQYAMVHRLLRYAVRESGMSDLDLLCTIMDQLEQAEMDDTAEWEDLPEVDGAVCHNCRNTTWKHDPETDEMHCAACSQSQ